MGDCAVSHACKGLGATIRRTFSERVLWMPAHCSAGSIGGKTLSNGQPLMAHDVAGNAYVDELAKRLA